MTFSKSRVKEIRSSNYKKYSNALEVEGIIPALRRIVELMPHQSGSKLIDTDARIEYTALLSLIHDITEGHRKSASIQALEIWLNYREMALTSVTFNSNGYSEHPELAHEETFKRLIRTDAERSARRKDALLVKMALHLAAQGRLEEKVVAKPRSEEFTRYLESQKPPDVAAIVASVLGKEVDDALPVA